MNSLFGVMATLNYGFFIYYIFLRATDTTVITEYSTDNFQITLLNIAICPDILRNPFTWHYNFQTFEIPIL